MSRAASGLENVSIRHFLRAIGGARQTEAAKNGRLERFAIATPSRESVAPLASSPGFSLLPRNIYV